MSRASSGLMSDTMSARPSSNIWTASVGVLYRVMVSRGKTGAPPQ